MPWHLVVSFIRAIPKWPEAVQALGMRAGIVVNVTRADRRRLEVILSDRSAPQKHVWRAQIILATADGCGTIEIMLRVDPLALDYQRRARVTRPGRQGRQAGSRCAR